MSLTTKITRSWNDGAVTNAWIKEVVTDSAGGSYSDSIPDLTTDKMLVLSIDITLLKALLIASDRDLTLEINHPGGTSTAPDQTIALKANCPIDWCDDDIEDCPLDQDVTEIYVTNASGSAAQLEIRAPQDATP